MPCHLFGNFFQIRVNPYHNIESSKNLPAKCREVRLSVEEICPFLFWCAILTETDTPRGVSLRGRDSVELPKRSPNRIRGFDYSQNGAYFITICTQNRQRILSKIVGTPVPGCPQAPCPELLSYGKTADKYIRQMDTFYTNMH